MQVGDAGHSPHSALSELRYQCVHDTGNNSPVCHQKFTSTRWQHGNQVENTDFLGACWAVGAVFLSRLLPYFKWRDPRDPAFEWMVFLSWGGYLCPPVLFANLQLMLSHCFSLLLPSWWINTLMVQAGLGWSAWRVCHTIKRQDIPSVSPGRAGTGVGSCQTLRSTHQLFALDEVQTPSENETALSAAAPGELCPLFISAQQLKNAFLFIFFSYCRVNTAPREWSAGYSSCPEPTDRIVCWVSASPTCTKSLWRVVTEGLLTWGTAQRNLRA